MIFRYTVSCPGCHSSIRLRIQVGHEEAQRFYFVCGACGAASRCELRVGDEAEVFLEVPDADLLEEGAPVDQTVTIATDLPVRVDAAEMHHPGGSPFLMAVSLLDELFEDYAGRLGMMDELVRRWSAFQRLIGFYENERWSHFDGEFTRIASEEVPNGSAPLWVRDDLLHRLLDLAFAPVMTTRRYYPDLRADLWDRITEGSTAEHALAYARSEFRTTRFWNDRNAVFRSLDLYVNTWPALLPALPLELMDGSKSEGLRIMRDDFPRLRDLYLNVFEISHKALAYVFGLFNAATRGSPDSFQPPATIDLEGFRRLANSRKIQKLEALPVWKEVWPQMFDRTLRNAIGHSSARHDLASGEVWTDAGDRIPYASFVRSCLLLIHPILLSLNVMKLIRVYGFMADE